jgi:NAD(P)-dependent dehydrogenase (short-subunit alcohol dehydrogenase family)
LPQVFLLLAFGVVVSSSVFAATPAGNASAAVLITGASSGIGKRTTELLASKGYFVYAGARKKKDLDALNTIKNVEAVRLDVTIQDDIDKAVVKITLAGRGLYGVVNNAGVGVVGSLVELEEKDLDFQFDVNVYGPYRITKAFFPLLRESKGRVVNISSISGILSSPLMGPYTMSKHALEAYTDSLAGELLKTGIIVVAIEPGNYASKIGRSIKKRNQDLGRSSKGSMHENELTEMMDQIADRDDMADPIAVARAVEHALFSENPKARYMVVPNQEEAAWTIGKAMQEMVQLNHDQPYSYDRDALVKMLDQALESL